MQYQKYRYPSLTKSYKNYYPFKIGTTSFIYPDLYVPNVKMLGPFVDEIEMLLFESGPAASLLSNAVINELKHLSQELQISYNIHLPTDISISDPAPVKQDKAVDTLMRIIERVAPLSPSSHTLHVPYSGAVYGENHLRKWQNDIHKNLEKIVSAGVSADRLAIETLDYPIELLERVIRDLKLSICLDIGHLIISGADIPSVFNRSFEAVSIIHLHGVKDRKDHGPLDRLSDNLLDAVIGRLKKFSGTVSLEVFNFENLKSSLDVLEQRWDL
ncbi:MAG: sugar phosphate isomerase/epimerase [Deltaproteobacteria bacterium]|nr:sugar phosphate isomerase/epimerase [Deltaproteobacteria bacterium]